ncbi:hypothetical protein MPTK1_4g16770 [Marchantia polymorpha subsp. ruderalis]|uniref:Secreted protein n=2 Tax=Marchantia polymorpha TaxID=3197 RepID=A0AAF6BAL9_MARPO|nr:hypothetical protein MARPO_0148s0043 [Marchantia polymorpha]BBN09053.1 hypothetical protein Mp_4g16770 [Marchantia polymorpha subsp. ruderalis]|eukprot:PTQ29101.1 hypothetical protein MARPO_0148s0043 [Marchantia polymorpha]
MAGCRYFDRLVIFFQVLWTLDSICLRASCSRRCLFHHLLITLFLDFDGKERYKFCVQTHGLHANLI